MSVFDIFSGGFGFAQKLVAAAQGPATNPEWAFWPFGPARSFWPMASKLILVAVILGGIAYGLRKLYGPGGKFRPDWVDEMNAEMREKERREAEAREAARAAAAQKEEDPQ